MRHMKEADFELLKTRGFEVVGEGWTGGLQLIDNSGGVAKLLIFHGEIGWEARVSVRRGSTQLSHGMPDGQHECSLRCPNAPPTDDRLDVVLDWLDEAAILLGQMIEELCPR